jgi:hypothetical protein
VTGSYQLTQASAGQNAENILLIKHKPTAMHFLWAFTQHLNASVVPEVQTLKNPSAVEDMALALTSTF